MIDKKAEIIHEYEETKNIPVDFRYTEYVESYESYMIKMGLDPEKIEDRYNLALLAKAQQNEDKFQGIMEITLQHNIPDTAEYALKNINAMFEDFLMEIGRRLKKERIKKGYSVSELSQLSGVAATIIYRIESSANSVGLRSLLRLMWSLNVSPAQLIPFDEYAHSKTFGDVIEEMTSNLSPKQKQYLLKVIMTDIGFLNADSNLIKSDIEYSNGIIVENKK